VKILFYIIAATFLFFTAPIWVFAAGILGLATGIGAGTAIIAANHAPPAAPAPVARPAPSPPTYVAVAPAATTPPLTALLSPAAQPVVCAWVYDHQACRTVSEWAEKAHEWCERAAQSTARRQAMQAKGWGTNRLFMTPCGAEFAREGQAEAVAGTICAAEQGVSPRRKLNQPRVRNIKEKTYRNDQDSRNRPSGSPSQSRMPYYRRTLCRLLALLALVGVGGCSASGPGACV
jgi:hypothetical protein